MMRLSSKFWYNTKTKEVCKKKPNEPKNWEHWDSKKEFEFYYDILLPIVSKFPGVFVKRQAEFPVKQDFDSIFPRGRYVCDFELYSPKFNESIWIEYKGDWVLHTPLAFSNWLNHLRFLEARNHELMRDNFIIVGSHHIAKKLPDFTHVYTPKSKKLKDRIRHLCIAATAFKS